DERGFPKNIVLRNKSANVISDAFRMFYVFTKWIKKIRPDVIHAHYAFSSGFLAAITKPIHKAPVVITSHGEDILLNREINLGMRIGKTKNILIKFTIRNCGRHILVSNSMKEAAKEAGSDEEKIQIIYNMYIPSDAKVTEEDVENVKIKYSIPLDKQIILSVSRLHAQKGLRYLVEAMEGIVKEHPDAFLVIAGDGEERETLEKLVKEKGLESDVKYTGFIDDWEKQALTKSCDIFCMPSVEEAFGIALFDPMYYSKPIVASDVGGMPELLGGSNTLVRKKDPVALSKAIVKLLSSATRAGQNGHDRLKYFYPDVIVEQYEEVYRSLVPIQGD
ncbi:MAG: glycosyltransferase, partial [Candidatus Thermoplasmatota archaeon]|nr:glycosyltransferase [Candidatus Thermoplasmatota archaeon]